MGIEFGPTIVQERAVLTVLCKMSLKIATVIEAITTEFLRSLTHIVVASNDTQYTILSDANTNIETIPISHSSLKVVWAHITLKTILLPHVV